MDLKWNKIKQSPPGMLVTVNNHKMHVFQKGTGSDTIVLMAGSGTCCPVIDFKPLWSLLSKKFKVVVIEKAGYGWSETADVSRDIDTLLYETRTALTVAGLSPPYILMPHSMSGLEALAWTVRFPDEVRAIIGLDAAIPVFYEKITPLKAAALPLLYRILSISTKIGLSRPMAHIAEKSIKACGQFSEKDIALYKQMFIHNSFTKNMAEEAKCCCDNAKKVKALDLSVKTPYLSFISDGKEIKTDNWRQLLIDFVRNFEHGKYVLLDCGHYIHYYQPEKIAIETENFIFGLQKTGCKLEKV